MQKLDLKTPEAIQDFLNTLPFNFELNGETCDSVDTILKRGSAHCFEGALIAAYALQKLGHRPLILDLKADKTDFDHVVVLFKRDGYFGAISKTNHGVLRYREPVYKSIRELVMSYFHEYFLPNGKKTLRSYSKPFDLSRFGTRWIDSSEDVFDIAHMLDKSPHTDILNKKQIKSLRKADPIEIKIGEIVEYKK